MAFTCLKVSEYLEVTKNKKKITFNLRSIIHFGFYIIFVCCYFKNRYKIHRRKIIFMFIKLELTMKKIEINRAFEKDVCNVNRIKV